MASPLVAEIRFYEIGMKVGLKGFRLENFVAEQLYLNQIPRVPEQPFRKEQPQQQQ